MYSELEVTVCVSVWTSVTDQIYDGCDGESRPVSFQLHVRALELNTRIKAPSLSVAWPAVLQWL